MIQREIITHSSLSRFKSCRRSYYYRYVLGLVPRINSEALRLGSLVHKGLEIGREAALAETQGVYAATQEEASELETMRITADSMLTGYAKALPPLDLIQTEIPFDLTLRNPATRRCSPKFILAGKVDGLAKRNTGIYLVEYKTASVIDRQYVERLALDSQVTLYIYALQRLMDRRIDGVIYRVLRKPSIRQRQNESITQFQDRLVEDYLKRPEWYFYEELLFRSQEDIQEFEKELWQVAQDLKDTMNSGRWYRNTSRCSDYGLCTYSHLCLNEPGSEALYEYREPHEELTK